MQYRRLEKIGKDVSLLGFGTMRLPTKPSGAVDEETAIRMIRTAIDNGINYLDTAYTYHIEGESEIVVGKALKDGYRKKVLIADKMPVWMVKSEEDLERIFNDQLTRLDVDFIDMYLFHCVNKFNYKWAERLQLIPFLEKKKAMGKINHIGFSFHDSVNLFKEVIDSYDWDFCQIQLNYMDKEFQAGLEGLKYASNRGIDVIVMEPLKGGRLTDDIPPTVQNLWNSADTPRSPAEWGFKWLASHPEVKLILCGMRAEEQLMANLEIFSKDDLGELLNSELKLIDKVSHEYNQLIKYFCTGCGYCMPCAKKLDIPKLVSYYNDSQVYNNSRGIKAEYIKWIPAGRHASDCIGCGECEDKCPQALPIVQIMNEAAQEFGI
jgi:predicted aldo/keto reductase-like oxidoreductase